MWKFVNPKEKRLPIPNPKTCWVLLVFVTNFNFRIFYNFPTNPFSITPFTSYIPLFPLMREETWGSVRFLTRTVRAPLRVARSLLRYIVCTRRNSSPNLQVRAPLRVAHSLLCKVLSERVTWSHPLTTPHIYCFNRPAK